MIRGSLALAIVSFCVLAGAWGAVGPSTDFDFVNAMYGPWEVEELGNFSFDAKYRNTWWLHSTPERVLSRFAEESLRAAASNVTYIAGLYYHAAPWDRLDFNYTRFVRRTGEMDRFTPSPLDETWWQKTMHEPAVAVANLSLHYPIWGLVWDIELYGNDVTEREDYCYDLPALHRFANASGIVVPDLPINWGYNWLRQMGLLDQYHDWIYGEMYSMARATEEAVHAINPEFALGLLGTEDSWHHWAILQAFNSSTAPVTSWCEYTYGGYRTLGSQGVTHYQELWEEHGLNGKFLPGVRPSHEFGKFMWDLGMAARHNGAYWIYQHNGDPFAKISRETYARMYEIYHEFVFLNGSDVYPLPAFELLPGAGVLPYTAPGKAVSMLIYTLDEEAPLGFDILTDSEEIVYVGENLTKKLIRPAGRNLSLSSEDLPCFVYGLEEKDLEPTETWALIIELKALLEILPTAGLEPPAYAGESLSRALASFQQGRYDEAKSAALENRDQLYVWIFEKLGPIVQSGLANPREAEYPVGILRGIYNAQRRYTMDVEDVVKGSEYLPGSLLTVRRGEMLLVEALGAAAEYRVEETGPALLVGIILCGFVVGKRLLRSRPGLERASVDPGQVPPAGWTLSGARFDGSAL